MGLERELGGGGMGLDREEVWLEREGWGWIGRGGEGVWLGGGVGLERKGLACESDLHAA